MLRSTIYLPIVHTNPTPPAQILFKALKIHVLQLHEAMIWDDCLAAAAVGRAVQVSYEWAHSYKGLWVNQFVRSRCTIPKTYPDSGNSVESLVGGVQDPIAALGFLLNSPKHADHLLGNGWFNSQSRIGIAYLQRVGSPYQYYYCILISG